MGDGKNLKKNSKKVLTLEKKKHTIKGMKNEAYSMKERPEDNIVFWSADEKELYCRDLNGVCAFANENEETEKFRFYETESGLMFCFVEIFVINKELSSVDTRRGNFCFLARNDNGTLRLPLRAELADIFAFIDWQREYHFYAQADSFFA